MYFCETGKGGEEARASSQRSRRSKRPDDSVAGHFGARHMISRLEGTANQPKERPMSGVSGCDRGSGTSQIVLESRFISFHFVSLVF